MLLGGETNPLVLRKSLLKLFVIGCATALFTGITVETAVEVAAIHPAAPLPLPARP